MLRRAIIVLLLGVFSASVYADKASLKLYVFDCGSIRMPSVEAFSVKDTETDVRELVVPCYIVEHEKGLLLWDGGLPSGLAENKGYDENGSRLDKTFAEQIKALNLDMHSFDYVAFSHFHYDHIGVANEVKDAVLLIQKEEYEAAFTNEEIFEHFQPPLYAGLRELELKVLKGDYDVFGDGSVEIISAPGHTPGHQVLYLDLPNYGPLVLSGDLYHFRISRSERRVPTFNYDAQASLKSMDKVEALLKKRNAKFWIEHERELFDTLKKAPAFYN